MAKNNFFDDLDKTLDQFSDFLENGLEPINKEIGGFINDIDRFIKSISSSNSMQDGQIKLPEIKEFLIKLVNPLKEISELKDKYSEVLSPGFFDNYYNNYQLFIKFLNSDDFREFAFAPASTKYHGDKLSGLLIHSLRVYYCALKLAKAFDQTYVDIDFISCLLHDACKMYQYNYKYGSDRKFYINYNTNIILPHGSESVLRLVKYGFKLSDGWTTAVAYHMGAFMEGDARNYGNACEQYPEVLILHTADMMASKCYGE